MLLFINGEAGSMNSSQFLLGLLRAEVWLEKAAIFGNLFTEYAHMKRLKAIRLEKHLPA